MQEITFELRDEFNRESFAKSLITLLENENDIFPLAINGSWGTGKTEFCIKTVYLINKKYNNKFVSGYMNAFAEDPYDDPLYSLLSILYETFIKKEKKSETLTAITKVLLTRLSTKILCSFHPILGEITKETIDALKNIREEEFEENFKNRCKLDKYFQDFKNLIKEIARDKKFVLFIDELDRCRPDFALHLLEIIKHVFDIPNLKIIFVLNLKQLVEVVKHNYCNDEKVAKEYLDKFFQLQLKLPNYSKDEYGTQSSNSSKYFDIEIDRLGLREISIFINNDCYVKTKPSCGIELLKELIEYRKLSLRDVEKLTKYILAFSTFINCPKHYPTAFKLILAYAIFDFTFEERLFENYKSYNNAFKDFGDLLIGNLQDNSHIPFRNVIYRLLFLDDDELINQYGTLAPLKTRRELLTNTFFNLENLINNT